MFINLIDRFGTTLNLSQNEALESDFVKQLCTDLIHCHVVVIDTNRNQVFAIKEDSEILESDSV